MRVQDELGTVEHLGAEEGTAPVLTVVLIANYACFQDLTQLAEVGKHVLILPVLGHLTHEQAHVNARVLLQRVLLEEVLLCQGWLCVLKLADRFFVVMRMLQSWVYQ